MKTSKKLRNGRVIAIAVAGAAAGLAVGGAVLPALASDHPTVTPATTQVAPHFAKNASGLSFGSAAQAVSPDTEPDLQQVDATNGKTGYVKKTELDAANGSNVSSPAEALAWNKKAATPRSIPVYDQDGVTVIGTFTVGNTETGAAAQPTTVTGK